MSPRNPIGPQNLFSLADSMRRVNEYGHWRSQQEASTKTRRSPSEAFAAAEERYARPARGEVPKSRSRPQSPVSMSKLEALAVLGLTRGATADAIRAAHKRLATTINHARDVLLRDRVSRSASR